MPRKEGRKRTQHHTKCEEDSPQETRKRKLPLSVACVGVLVGQCLSETQREKKNKANQTQREDPMPRKGQRGKKNRKGGRKGRGKGEGGMSQLRKLAEMRRENLAEFRDALVEGLDERFRLFFDDVKRQIFMDAVAHTIEYYKANWRDANSEAIFEEKRREVMEAWDELRKYMAEEWKEENQELLAQRAEARKQKEREKMMERLGIKKRRRSQQQHRHNAKMSEKQRLRKLRRKMEEEAKQCDAEDSGDDERIKEKARRMFREKGMGKQRKEKEEEAEESAESEWENESAVETEEAMRAKGEDSPFVRGNVEFEDESSDEGSERPKRKQKEKQKQKRPQHQAKPMTPTQQPEEQKRGERKEDKPLKSPICVVMGHVDTGKTKILDRIRHTSVQDREAGGITQQIGATYLSIDYIKGATASLQSEVQKELKYKVPGLLFIDTPGHEAFSNLRSRGSSLCDIAVLVVDLMHGLENQTVESLNMLVDRGVPFVVALNKIDRLLDWKVTENAAFITSIKTQAKHTKQDFETRWAKTMTQFAEHGHNAALYYENRDMKRDISVVPTSAHTGEGIPDLLYLLVQLTQKYMAKRLRYEEEKFSCSVLEVRNTAGHGATLDVILSNGTLRKEDTLVVCGMKGVAIETKVRALMLPSEASDMREKTQYRNVDEVHASAGICISANNLTDAVAGSHLQILPRNLKNLKDPARRNEVRERVRDEVQSEYDKVFKNINKDQRGVYVQASTLGSLEALVGFLKDQRIPICGMGIGNVKKENVFKAAVMLEHQREFAVILAFNVSINQDARRVAEEQGVRIFEAEIIYHLQESFEKYLQEVREQRKLGAKDLAVFPALLEVLPDHIIHNRTPLILGCLVRRGELRINTPMCAQLYNKEGEAAPLYIGHVESIQSEGKDVRIGKVGDKLAVKFRGDDTTTNIQIGRQFQTDDPLVSMISAASLSALKANFKDELESNRDMIAHLMELKKYFHIIGRS